MYSILIYNQSTVATNLDCQTMVDACKLQLIAFCNAWSKVVPQLRFVSGAIPRLILPDTWIIVIKDNSDYAGAEAYHSEDNDVVDGSIFVKTILHNGGVMLYKDAHTETVASALSHEILEAIGDPFTNGWWQDNNGVYYCAENCDPVQDGIMPFIVTEKNALTGVLGRVVVGLSNYVLPAWTDGENTTGPFDALHILKAPFTLSRQGYAVVDDGTVHNIYGQNTSEATAKIARSASSRAQRRLVGKVST